jgi:hypothetical protein
MRIPSLHLPTLTMALGVAAALSALVLGILVLAGFILPEYTTGELRTTMGVVLILLSIFRSLRLYYERKRSRQSNQTDLHEQAS